MIEGRDVYEAAGRLAGVAHRTPVLRSRTLDEHAGVEVLVKAECLQRSGSFKFRGAYNRIASMSDEERARGVAAYSSGNHAQAVALAARLLNAKATILMPEDAPALKLEATRGYGAEVVTYDRYKEDREALGNRLAEERGLTLVPPFDDPLVMAGQGTAALELIEDAGELDYLVTPVGGGGLIAGCATIAKELHPNIAVIGVEPEAGDDTRRSLEARERIEIQVPRTIADALQVPAPGRLTFEVNKRLVDEVVTVSDKELVHAMRFLFERTKLVAEPGGAAAVAALLAGKVPPAAGRAGDGGKAAGRVGAVVSGGNVGAERFAELVQTYAA
ncbi:MAG TPA: pyridoxal-phosphate dependent enzyme [Thermoleophilaceae bacterium]|nr:pyridoxal-phosphate dependent enzyme [Thermoleophilaceae bacterium]